MQLPVQARSWRQMLQQATLGYKLCGHPGEVPPESIARRARTATGIVKELGGYDSLDPADQLFWYDALMRERRAREARAAKKRGVKRKRVTSKAAAAAAANTTPKNASRAGSRNSTHPRSGRAHLRCSSSGSSTPASCSSGSSSNSSASSESETEGPQETQSAEGQLPSRSSGRTRLQMQQAQEAVAGILLESLAEEPPQGCPLHNETS